MISQLKNIQIHWHCLLNVLLSHILPVCICVLFCCAGWRKHKWLLCDHLPVGLPPPSHWSHRRSDQGQEPALIQSERSGHHYGSPTPLQGWNDSEGWRETLWLLKSSFWTYLKGCSCATQGILVLLLSECNELFSPCGFHFIDVWRQKFLQNFCFFLWRIICDYFGVNVGESHSGSAGCSSKQINKCKKMQQTKHFKATTKHDKNLSCISKVWFSC